MLVGKRLFAKKTQSAEMSLQITSMADIFTILLVFLLKSYSTGLVDITPANNIRLPETAVKTPLTKAMVVEVSKSAVHIEGNEIIRLKQFEFPNEDVLTGGLSKALETAMAQERAKGRTLAGENTPPDARFLLVADQETPYSTLKVVLLTSAKYGYTDVKMILLEKE